MKYPTFTRPWRGFAICLLLQTCSAAEPLIEVHVQGRRIEGTPLHWSSQCVTMLTASGTRCDISPRAVQRFRRLDGSLVPSTQRQIGQQLHTEFRTQFSITATEHYLVVYPADRVDCWSRPLEDLYTEFHAFFRNRAYRLQKTRFPLVVIVLPTKEALLRTAAQSGHADTRKLAGYYCDRSNRIWIHAPEPNSGQLTLSAHVTLRHEAAHQLAFNTGVHQRFSPTPLWIAEGLAMLFEMPPPNAEAQPANSAISLFARETAVRPKHYSPRGQYIPLEILVANDLVFQQTPEMAYAQSATLTRFLVRTHPARYLDYLKRVASRPGFTLYAPAAKRADFSSSFPGNLALLESKWLAFTEAPR